MGQHVIAGEPPVAFLLRRSAQARRMSLRVSGLDGRVTLTIPRSASLSEALAFADEKSDWLRARLRESPDHVAVGHGSTIPFEGRMTHVLQGAGRGIRHEAAGLRVPGPAVSAGARLQAWLKARARERLAAASDHYAARLGRGYTRLSLRDTRSRWGSCSAGGALMYSWRLILAPPEVLEYVAAHEVAHLAQMNHSPAFWAEVARLCPGHAAPRRWLRQHGADLHRYRFAA